MKKVRYDFLADIKQLAKDIKAGLICSTCGKKPSECEHGRKKIQK